MKSATVCHPARNCASLLLTQWPSVTSPPAAWFIIRFSTPTLTNPSAMLAMLNWLGVKPSYSRPRVSDDNAYAESLFRTAKYRPEFPSKGFASLEAARAWATDFVRWYNFEHHHSGINYLSPAARHDGQDKAILAKRHDLYLQARKLNPARWSGATRNWSPIGPVTLNPERDSVVAAHLKRIDSQPLAA